MKILSKIPRKKIFGIALAAITGIGMLTGMGISIVSGATFAAGTTIGLGTAAGAAAFSLLGATMGALAGATAGAMGWLFTRNQRLIKDLTLAGAVLGSVHTGYSGAQLGYKITAEAQEQKGNFNKVAEKQEPTVGHAPASKADYVMSIDSLISQKKREAAEQKPKLKK